ncbi:TraB/VirB10 family protein [Legionella quateirensis]|uniref:Conjugative transfer protein TraB n=1 Tax=Legionella quateirensis TaxID=45072 RepID=A0A378PB75_9GAMM|nr:TraB/VirB10 family protein [Legionella quateirensis]KTD54003.1 putative conjugative transfer protein TraB [Legionella quateirensis]STY83144.1 Conjugative transfer protein TraB [Legionella quateirensis]
MFKKIKRWLTLKPQNANKLAKKEQLKHAAILLLVGGASYGFYCYSSAEKKKPVHQEEAPFESIFESTFNQGSDEALLLQQQQQIDSLKELVAEHHKNQQKAAPVNTEDSETKALVQAMKEQLAHLEEENKKMNEQLQVALVSTRQASLVTVRPPTREEMEAQQKKKHLAERELLAKSGLETVQFNNRKKRNKEVRTAKNYVWAGTFVEGVLLTGVLGDAGINGSKNMGTALIRLTSGGIMPNNQHSHLEDCVALVSTYGDLSGSSVVMHLETLSCAGNNINFEQKAYGSVFDLDAMQDLRGTSILKTKPLLTYSAAAGMLAGFGDGLKNLNTAQTINPGAGTITTYGQASTLAQSAAGGALSNPANRISDYVMRIADIYHPLVVARAGRRVSVLFTKGFWIDKEHQVYESGRAINEGHAQNESGVTTTVSRAYELNTHPVNGASLMQSNNQEPMVQTVNPVENPLLNQPGQPPTPLFSTVQNEEPLHD